MKSHNPETKLNPTFLLTLQMENRFCSQLSLLEEEEGQEKKMEEEAVQELQRRREDNRRHCGD